MGNIINTPASIAAALGKMQGQRIRYKANLAAMQPRPEIDVLPKMAEPTVSAPEMPTNPYENTNKVIGNPMQNADVMNPKTVEEQRNEILQRPAVLSEPIASEQQEIPQQSESHIDWQQQFWNEYDANRVRLNALYDEDENQRKYENSRRTIGNISDAISGIANMIGTANGASNIQTPTTSKYIDERIARDSALRNARISMLNQDNNRLLSNAISLRRADTYDTNAETRRNRVDNEIQNTQNKWENEKEKSSLNREKFEYGKEKDDRNYELKKEQIANTNANQSANRAAANARNAANIESRESEGEKNRQYKQEMQNQKDEKKDNKDIAENISRRLEFKRQLETENAPATITNDLSTESGVARAKEWIKNKKEESKNAPWKGGNSGEKTIDWE